MFVVSMKASKKKARDYIGGDPDSLGRSTVLFAAG